MRIIDTQIHDVGPLWDWRGENTELQHRLLTELLISYIDAVGVHGVVLFPGGDAAPAAWAAAQLPDRFCYVPHITPDEPDIDGAVRAAKKRHDKGQVGLRAIIGWPMDGKEARRLEAGAWDPIFAACERHEVPLFTFITGWLSHAVNIATRYPRLTLIIDHIGLRQPPLDDRDDPPFKSLSQVLDLAKLPNISIKLCGLPSLSREAYPYADAARPLREIVDAFGANRLMWASDTTRFKGRIGLVGYQNPRAAGDYAGKHTYAESLHFLRESPVLSAQEKEAILGGTARRLLGWSFGA